MSDGKLARRSQATATDGQADTYWRGTSFGNRHKTARHGTDIECVLPDVGYLNHADIKNISDAPRSLTLIFC